ncbi:hypothetical protein A176_004186 [Myxococcus hansupus]|uniref:Uncharacterized protein n=1 Tax=Pseudomyxococcus hansupus TaxID=1297742 RepID=A0A0H4WWT2_9BACT|nr:hypothetical protein A176_004186 [Myxococcus hansupus]
MAPLTAHQVQDSTRRVESFGNERTHAALQVRPLRVSRHHTCHGTPSRKETKPTLHSALARCVNLGAGETRGN